MLCCVMCEKKLNKGLLMIKKKGTILEKKNPKGQLKGTLRLSLSIPLNYLSVPLSVATKSLVIISP